MRSVSFLASYVVLTILGIQACGGAEKHDLIGDPGLIFDASLSASDYSIHGVGLGDSASAIESKFIVKRDGSKIRTKGDVTFNLAAGKIEEITLGEKFVKSVGLIDETDIEALFGPADEILTLPLEDHDLARVYAYKSRDLVVRWTRIPVGQSNIALGKNVIADTRSSLSSVRSFQDYLKEGYDAQVAKNYKKSIKHLSRAVQMQPENPGARVGLAKSYLFDGQIEKARREFRNVLAMNPGVKMASEAHHGLALVFIEMGESVRARIEMQRAVRLNPSSETSKATAKLLARQFGEKVIDETETEVFEDDDLSSCLVYRVAHFAAETTISMEEPWKPQSSHGFSVDVYYELYGLNGLEQLRGRKLDCSIGAVITRFDLTLLIAKAASKKRMPSPSEIRDLVLKNR